MGGQGKAPRDVLNDQIFWVEVKSNSCDGDEIIETGNLRSLKSVFT